MRLLSCASAGEWADPHRRAKATNSRARRCMGRSVRVRGATSRAQIRRWLNMDATGGSAVPLVPATYGRSGYRNENNSRLKVRVKVPVWLFRRQDSDRDRILLGSADLQQQRLCRNLVLHGLADAVAVGRVAKTLWLEKMSVLHQIDPG